MTAIELKERLIVKISHTDNEELLDQISRLIEFEEETEDIYILSPDEIKMVKEGIEQIENGQFFSNEEANRIFDKCLGR